MKNKFLYLLMASLLPVVLQGGQAARDNLAICGPTFGGWSPISHASSNGAVCDLHTALQELYRSTSSGSVSVESSDEAFDLLGKKRVRSTSSLSKEKFLDIGSACSNFSDVVSVGSFSDDSDFDGCRPLTLAGVLDLKDQGCNLTAAEGLPYEQIGFAPSCRSANDELKCKITTKAKELLSSAQAAAQHGDTQHLTKLITCLRKNPNLNKWYDARGNTLADHLVGLSCKDEEQKADLCFLEQILKRTRSAKSDSANPVFQRLHAVAQHIKEATAPEKCERCYCMEPENCSSCPASNWSWRKLKCREAAQAIFFETPDNKLSARKCQAAAELVAAIDHNDTGKIDKLMAANPKLPFYCDDQRYFPMQYAAKFNRPDLIAKFRAAGVHADHSYDGMLTPLQLAVVNGHIESVDKLLALGADANKEIYSGDQMDPTSTGDMTARTLASVLARGNQPNAKNICLALQQRQ